MNCLGISRHHTGDAHMRSPFWMTLGALATLFANCSSPGGDSATGVQYTSTDSAGVQLAVTRWSDPHPQPNSLSLFDHTGNWLVDRPIEKVEELLPTLQFRIADAHDGFLIINNPTSFRIAADLEEGAVDNPNCRFAADGSYEGVVGEPSTMWVLYDLER